MSRGWGRRTRGLRATRAQSATVGASLLVAITVIGTTGVVVLGSEAIDDWSRQADLERAEQAMTQFDSRAAQVALGGSSRQTVDFGWSGGTFEVREGTGTLTITHVDYNYTGGNASADDPAGDDQIVYRTTELGSFVYANGDTRIAYQGGGVWRKTGDGPARLVSPPEFHYRDGTLTFPVVRVSGGSTHAASGRTTVTVERPAPSFRRTYPNESASYANGRAFANPLSEGYVTVTVESEFYEGWAEYFRTRTDGVVSVDHGERRARVKLLTLGTQGNFGVPAEGSEFGIRGIESGHSLRQFEFTLRPKDDQSSEFSNLRWSMFVDDGGRHFEIAVRNRGNLKCDAAGTIDDPVTVSMYYSYLDDGVRKSHGWQNTEDFEVECVPDGDGGYVATLPLDFTGSGHRMNYTDVPKSDLSKFDSENAQFVTSLDFAAHPEDDTAENATTYTTPDAEDLAYLTRHYFGTFGPTFQLETSDQQSGNAAGVSETTSSGTIYYAGDDRVITFLHVTENDVRVELS
ncbi:DUF7289 family protein [Halomarina pelagica]|uniref:DUF7289 family protein n=1 Tax=Halomarina pelagica TaxID=2961599 RepID=UPI0020C2B7F6|nr:hypothetical protein [Halomarina sp. BND7]